MEKKSFINFINKYNLGGLCNQVKLSCKDGTLTTKFASDQKDMIGFVAAKGIAFTDDASEVGIFNTGTLLKILSIMQPNINIKLNEELGKYVSMDISDQSLSSQIMLADLEIIESPPTLKQIPPTDIKMTVSSSTIDQFIKAKGALADSEVIAFIQNGDDVNLIINYADHNTDTITIAMDAEIVADSIPVMKFNANIIKEIFSANKDCESGTIELSGQGLMTIQFNTDEIRTKYLVVMLQN